MDSFMAAEYGLSDNAHFAGKTRQLFRAFFGIMRVCLGYLPARLALRIASMCHWPLERFHGREHRVAWWEGYFDHWLRDDKGGEQLSMKLDSSGII